MPKTTFERWRSRPHSSEEVLKPIRPLNAYLQEKLSRGGLAGVIFSAVIVLSLVSFATTALSLYSLLTGDANEAVSAYLQEAEIRTPNDVVASVVEVNGPQAFEQGWLNLSANQAFWLLTGGIGVLAFLLIGAWQIRQQHRKLAFWKSRLAWTTIAALSAVLPVAYLSRNGVPDAIFSSDALISMGVTFGIQILVVVLSFFIASLVMSLFLGPYSSEWKHVRDWMLHLPLRVSGIGILTMLLCIFLVFSIAFSYATFHRNLEAPEDVERTAISDLDFTMNNLRAAFFQALRAERIRAIETLNEEDGFDSAVSTDLQVLLNAAGTRLFSDQESQLQVLQNGIRREQLEVVQMMVLAIESQLRMEVAARQISWEHGLDIDPWDWETYYIGEVNPGAAQGPSQFLALIRENEEILKRRTSDQRRQYIASNVDGLEASAAFVGCSPAWADDAGDDLEVLSRLAMLQTQIDIAPREIPEDGQDETALPFKRLPNVRETRNFVRSSLEGIAVNIATTMLNERLDADGRIEHIIRDLNPQQFVDLFEDLDLYLGSHQPLIRAALDKYVVESGEALNERTSDTSIYNNIDANGNIAFYQNSSPHHCNTSIGPHFRQILDRMEQAAVRYINAQSSARGERLTSGSPLIAITSLMTEVEELDDIETFNRNNELRAELEEALQEGPFANDDQLIVAVGEEASEIESTFSAIRAENSESTVNVPGCEDISAQTCLNNLRTKCTQVNNAIQILFTAVEDTGLVSADGSRLLDVSTVRFDCTTLSLDSVHQELLTQIDTAIAEVDKVFNRLTEPGFKKRKQQAEGVLKAAGEFAAKAAFGGRAPALQREVLLTADRVAKLHPVSSVRRTWDRFFTSTKLTFLGQNSADVEGDVDSGNRGDIMDDAALALAVGIDVMIVILAVVIAYMQSGPMVRIVRDLQGRITQDTLSSAHANINREDPSIFSRITQYTRPVRDKDYPFVLELDSFSDENARRRAERALGLLGPHAVLSESDEATYHLTDVARAYIEHLAGREREYVNVSTAAG